MEKFHTMDVSTLSKYIKNKSISPVELTESILGRINKYNKEYKSFISVTDELAIRQAKQSEKEIMKGIYKGKLHGIPMSIKDNIDVKGIISTKGAPATKTRKSSRDASIVNKLKANGAVIVGKTNMDEYANHITGINSTYGTIKNPLDQKHIVGGSSGGSASAVAAHLSYYSIGTDTAGSVRIPASCCGVYGLKPTYNLIPTMGIHPLSWSLDHVGIIAKSNSDTFYINDVLSPGIGMPQRETELKKNITVGILSNKDDNAEDVNDA